jgi:hypothetical protein
LSTIFSKPITSNLALRNQNLRGKLLSAKLGQLLSIRYASVVPGFFGVCGKFHDLDELETEINAHLYAYSLMAPDNVSGGSLSTRAARKGLAGVSRQR